MKYIHVDVDFVSKWVEEIVLPYDEGKSVSAFLQKIIFYRFGTPRVIIRDWGSHLCSRFFETSFQKYGVRQNVATPSHLQTSGQVKVYSREIQQIFAKTVNANRIYCSKMLDDALWSYCIAYKTTIDMSPYQLIYGMSCHFLAELKHKAIWVMKKLYFDWGSTSTKRVNY